MKVISIFAIAIGVLQSCNAFVPATSNTQCLTQSTTTARSMGLFDFFSEDARKEREERKQRECEEQEALQREIIARRSNPQKMEEYEAKVRVRRSLRMRGEDDAANKVDMYTGDVDEGQI